MMRASFPELLLSDQLAPMTVEIGFIDCPLDRVAAEYLSWRRNIPYDSRVVMSVADKSVSGNLSSILMHLLPLRSPLPDRYLLVPTKTNWTALFDNLSRGPSVSGDVAVLTRRLGCRGLRLVCDPIEIDGRVRQSVSAGGLVFEYLDPNMSGEQWPPARAIALVRESDGSWEWREHGTPLPFEQTDRFRARRRKDRFTLAMLRDYVTSLGLEPFDASWYAPEGHAIFVHETRTGLQPYNWRQYSLEEAQRLCLDADRASPALAF